VREEWWDEQIAEIEEHERRMEALNVRLAEAFLAQGPSRAEVEQEVADVLGEDETDAGSHAYVERLRRRLADEREEAR
jgi:hypothetical protein